MWKQSKVLWVMGKTRNALYKCGPFCPLFFFLPFSVLYQDHLLIYACSHFALVILFCCLFFVFSWLVWKKNELIGFTPFLFCLGFCWPDLLLLSSHSTAEKKLQCHLIFSQTCNGYYKPILYVWTNISHKSWYFLCALLWGLIAFFIEDKMVMSHVIVQLPSLVRHVACLIRQQPSVPRCMCFVSDIL